MFSISSRFYLHGSCLWFCCFSIGGGGEKKNNQQIVLFLGWVFNWRVAHYLELRECFFWVQEFLWLIWLYFFPPVEAPEETLYGLFSANNCLWWFFSSSFKDYQSASEPLSYAARSRLVPERPWTLLSIYPRPPLPTCHGLDKTWKCPRKAVSAHANYLRKVSTHVLQLSEFRIHQNNINLVFAHLDMIFWRNFKGFLADFYISGMWE